MISFHHSMTFKQVTFPPLQTDLATCTGNFTWSFHMIDRPYRPQTSAILPPCTDYSSGVTVQYKCKYRQTHLTISSFLKSK